MQIPDCLADKQISSLCFLVVYLLSACIEALFAYCLYVVCTKMNSKRMISMIVLLMVTNLSNSLWCWAEATRNDQACFYFNSYSDYNQELYVSAIWLLGFTASISDITFTLAHWLLAEKYLVLSTKIHSMVTTSHEENRLSTSSQDTMDRSQKSI